MGEIPGAVKLSLSHVPVQRNSLIKLNAGTAG
jgi:hypothetical protein